MERAEPNGRAKASAVPVPADMASQTPRQHADGGERVAIDGVFGIEGVLICRLSIEPDALFLILTKMSDCDNGFAERGKCRAMGRPGDWFRAET